MSVAKRFDIVDGWELENNNEDCLEYECPHHPKCRMNCIICNAPLPEMKDHIIPDCIADTYRVEFQKGLKDYVSAYTEKQAREVAIVGISRVSGFCPDHMVQIVKVEKLPRNPELLKWGRFV